MSLYLTKSLLSCLFSDAQFVSAFDAADKVYFLLREIAIEQINCAKVWPLHVGR